MQLSLAVSLLLFSFPGQGRMDSFDLASYRAWVKSLPQTFGHPLLFRNVNGSVLGAGHSAGTVSDIKGDFDGDGDVDLHDYFAFNICHSFSGPNVAVPPACAGFDFDADEDVDMKDAARFGELFTASIGAIQVEAGNLRPIPPSYFGYYSGEPGTPDNNALKGIARQRGYTDSDLWYEWTYEPFPGALEFTINNPSLPATSFWTLSPIEHGEYAFRLTVTNLITLESASDTVVLFVTGCDPPCDDGEECTEDICYFGDCYFGPADGPCDDQDLCTFDDQCYDGFCFGIPVSCPPGQICFSPTGTCETFQGEVCVIHPAGGEVDCVIDDDCDDGASCTEDTCIVDTGLCEFTPINARCADDLFCNGFQAICDPHDPDSDGDGCVRWDPCTGDDPFCEEDTDECRGCEIDAECDDGVACTADDCEDDGSCGNTPDDDFCDDDLFCTGAETCEPENDDADGNGCLSAGDPCTYDGLVCDEAENGCVECERDADCDDGVECTIDDCQVAAGTCSHTANDDACPSNATCDTHLGCVITCGPGETCEDGKCVPDPDQACGNGTLLCDDGLFCTGNEYCGEPIAGGTLYAANGCNVCHAADGSGGIGPGITTSTLPELLKNVIGSDPHPVKVQGFTPANAADLAAWLAGVTEAQCYSAGTSCADSQYCDEEYDQCFQVSNPGKDSCADPLNAEDGTVAFDNIGAQTDGPDGGPTCNFFGRTQIESDVWYCYTATCTGAAIASLCGSEYDTKMAVYAGCGCPSQAAAPLDCSDDDCGTGVQNTQSRVTWQATQGQQYMIRIGGFLGEQGEGRLTIRCGNVETCGLSGNDCYAESLLGTPGCSDATCCHGVCDVDQFCCDLEWDDFCAGEAEGLCDGSFAACAAGSGTCSTANGTPGCSDIVCCNNVCERDPYCCITEWDDNCASEAQAFCALSCGARAGDCFTAHSAPGCNSISCCHLVCPEDPFCCETEWDAACVSAAMQLCKQP